MRPRDAASRLPALAVIVGMGGVGAYLAARAGGPVAGALAVLATVCGAALTLSIDRRSVDSAFAGQAFDAVVFTVPGLLTVYFSFNAGGYMPGAPAFVAILLALLLVLRVTLVDEPFAGFSLPLAVATVALALYALWTLLSAGWSDAPARALIEFDRALVYLFALLLFGSIPRTSARLRWVVRGLVVGIVVVVVAGFATRVFPDRFPTTPNPIGNALLFFPIGYPNAICLLCMLGAILCLHLSSSLHERAEMRSFAAAALPVLGAAALLSQSRGAIGAGAVGLVTYVVLGRPRGLLPALVASVPATLVAVYAAHDADRLMMRSFPAGAVAQGHELAQTVALCAVAAAVLRLVLRPLDTRLRRVALPSHPRPVTYLAWAAALSAAVAIAVVAGGPDWVSDKYDGLLHGQRTETADADTQSATRANTGGRLDYWKVALRGYRERKLGGQGAGTYEFSWSRHRPSFFGGDPVTNAHSLYVETLHDLGLVGFLLIVGALSAILASQAPLGRGYNRSLYAALFAAGLTWAIQAGLDWIWQLPAVTAWLFAVAGAAMASRRRKTTGAVPTQGARVGIGLLLLIATIGPAIVFVSQRQLDESVDAFKRGDCSRTIERAAASVSTLAMRAEPYEAIAYCQARRGERRLALRAMEEAVEREPANPKFRYGLALMRGAAGLDPRPAARVARRFDPQDAATQALVRELARGTPRDRRRLTGILARTQRNLAVVR